MKFGERVKELRTRERITQRQLAEILDVNFTYISKIENDRLEAPPSERLIRRLALVLRVEPEELIELSGKLDARTFQDMSMKEPEARTVLRRIQRQPPKPSTWKRIGKILDEQDEE